METQQVRQLPLVRLVSDENIPLDQERAEAMLEVAGVMRRRALQLPEGDDLRAEFLRSAADYSLCAQLEWPPCSGAQRVELPRSG